MTKITYIPGEIANAAVDEHGNRKPVTRTHHIFDDTKGKSQAEINKEFGNAIGGLNSQNYVTVDSFNALPDTGEADTVYRVSNWDGIQQDPSVYSEYAWNGSQYVHLSTKTQIGEVFDISAYHATGGELAKYVDLAAALDSNNGGGVPQSLRKGGMSIKFIQGTAQSSDNKYVQFRYMSTSTAAADFTNVANWQSVEKITEPLFNALGYEQIIYAANDFEVTGTRYLSVVLQNYPTLVGIGNTVEVVFQADVDCVIIPYAYGNAGSIYHTYPQITLTANVPSTVIMSIDESQTYYAFGGLVTTAGNYSIKVTNHDFEKIKELNKIEADLIYDWILSESYTVVSASYTDGEIDSPVSVKWPDGETGTLTLTKNADGLITRVDASYKSSTYRLAITRNSEGNTTGTSIVKL